MTIILGLQELIGHLSTLIYKMYLYLMVATKNGSQKNYHLKKVNQLNIKQDLIVPINLKKIMNYS